ncbi:tetratricopeptide repeat protein [Streptacidiphilus sp. 4-A2]|nr:tetratricopeptide repeat protein [Streptacidiphilus sp. 4-A2]
MENLITHDESGRMVPSDREELARVVAELLDGPLDQPVLLRRAGVGLLVLGRRSEAIGLLERALALADARLAVVVHINLGDAHRYGGELEDAEPHYRSALWLSRAYARKGATSASSTWAGNGWTRDAPRRPGPVERALRQRRALGVPVCRFDRESAAAGRPGEAATGRAEAHCVVDLRSSTDVAAFVALP